MTRIFVRSLLGVMAAVAILATTGSASAQIQLNPAYGEQSLRGPSRSQGVVIWSHGRSVDSEDSLAPTPIYMKAMKDAGWDVFRLDRMRVSDTLPNSSHALAGYADRMRAQGYRKVVLTGQSFGAFISLMAAEQTDSIDAVVGTSPAAFGNFSEAYDSYRENATELWPILSGIRNARVMLFFFHGDDFDPGGRGPIARDILSRHGLTNLVVDQPALLTGHGAANTGLFVRRFAACIVRFAEQPPRAGDPPCDQSWGSTPSPGLLQAAASAGPRSGTSETAPSARPYLGTWYGTYINGREVALTVDRVDGDRVVADYVLGPGMESNEPLESARRAGHIDNGELVFDENGRNILRYQLRADGRLAAMWQERDGKGRLNTVLRRVD